MVFCFYWTVSRASVLLFNDLNNILFVYILHSVVYSFARECCLFLFLLSFSPFFRLVLLVVAAVGVVVTSDCRLRNRQAVWQRDRRACELEDSSLSSCYYALL